MNRAKKDKITKLFVGTLKKKFKNQLKKVILFGSRARGDNTSESDYDFILIFKKVTKKIDEYLNKLGAESLLKHGAVITDISITEKDLKKMQYEPFIMNAQREGIAL